MHDPKSRNSPGTSLEPFALGLQSGANLELWNLGTLQPANCGILENLGALPNLGTLPDNIATLEPWNLLLGGKAGLIELCRKSHQSTTIAIHHEYS